MKDTEKAKPGAGKPLLRESVVMQIAQVVYEANRAYCRTNGDTSLPPFELAPEWHKSTIRDGIRAIYEGRVTKPGESHASWLAEKEREGWKYGTVKNVSAKEHPSMLPYEQLSKAEQAKDHIFVAVVKAMIEALT